MENALISACLLGVACRYDGLSKPMPSETIEALRQKYHLIPVCPEIMGGLPTPRIPAEINAERCVIRKDGVDITAEYQKGASEALRLALLFDCKIAIFKERSPSCGKDVIYDGSFTKTLIQGDGIVAALLRQNGICVVGESEIDRLLTKINLENKREAL